MTAPLPLLIVRGRTAAVVVVAVALLLQPDPDAALVFCITLGSVTRSITTGMSVSNVHLAAIAAAATKPVNPTPQPSSKRIAVSHHLGYSSGQCYDLIGAFGFTLKRSCRRGDCTRTSIICSLLSRRRVID
jgi:hypothetical protein